MSNTRFQSFDEVADPAACPPRLAALRAELSRRRLQGFIVPRADEHQNEYVPPGAERLAWLTGFTGSAGACVVLDDKAAIFVDGRYTLQVREQVDTSLFSPESLIDTPPDTWIEKNLPSGARLGFDPWLHTPPQIEKLTRAVLAAGGQLVPVDTNPIDVVWTDRPAAPLGPVFLYPEQLAGRSAAEKITAVQAALGSLDGLVVTDAHAVAWLFNIRGSDVAHTPLPLSFALVPKEGRPTLFVDGRKLSNHVRAALGDLAEIAEPQALVPSLEEAGRSGRRLRFDTATAAFALVTALEAAGGKADIGSDPIALMKATKTDAEIAGSRRAHRRDGAAMARFLAWFATAAPAGGLTEIAAARQLEAYRSETGLLKDLSFPTIAAFGQHAASPHYRVTTASDLPIGPGLFLVDSGAQYEDGTTDITRTVAVGVPDAEMRRAFTLVLKGHIAIARAVFPAGTSGAQLDAFARRPLWEAGLDFDHGTGHGIGAFLSVHEGPQRLSKLGTTPLAPGMILSNEPGYYRAGAWGIRIENLVLVVPRAIEGAERTMLGFETISFTPIDRTLIDPALLTAEEIAWVDAYHAAVRAEIGADLDAPTRAWLEAATAPLGAAG